MIREGTRTILTSRLIVTDAKIEGYTGDNGERSPSNMSDSVHARLEQA